MAAVLPSGLTSRHRERLPVRSEGVHASGELGSTLVSGLDSGALDALVQRLLNTSIAELEPSDVRHLWASSGVALQDTPRQQRERALDRLVERLLADPRLSSDARRELAVAYGGDLAIRAAHGGDVRHGLALLETHGGGFGAASLALLDNVAAARRPVAPRADQAQPSVNAPVLGAASSAASARPAPGPGVASAPVATPIAQPVVAAPTQAQVAAFFGGSGSPAAPTTTTTSGTAGTGAPASGLVQEGPLPLLGAFAPGAPAEAREPTPIIQASTEPAGRYMVEHPEVYSAWVQNQQGASWQAYAQVHFELAGRAAGFEWPGGELVIDASAPPATLPALRYFEQNPDVMAAYRTDNQGLSAEAFARQHYAAFGSNEGRDWPIVRSQSEARHIPPEGILAQAERWTGHAMEKTTQVFPPVADVVSAAHRFMDNHPELDAEFQTLRQEYPDLQRSEYAMYYLFTYQSDANKAEWGPTELAARTAAGWASFFTIQGTAGEGLGFRSTWERLSNG